MFSFGWDFGFWFLVCSFWGVFVFVFLGVFFWFVFVVAVFVPEEKAPSSGQLEDKTQDDALGAFTFYHYFRPS